MWKQSGFCFFALAILFETTCGMSLRSPCPGVFAYEILNGETVGKISVPVQSYGLHKLKLSLSVGGLPEDEGNIVWLGKDDISNAIEKRGTTNFRVTFPSSEYVPKVTRLSWDKQILCYGPEEMLTDIEDTVTTINLEINLTLVPSEKKQFSNVGPVTTVTPVIQPTIQNVNQYHPVDLPVQTPPNTWPGYIGYNTNPYYTIWDSVIITTKRPVTIRTTRRPVTVWQPVAVYTPQSVSRNSFSTTTQTCGRNQLPNSIILMTRGEVTTPGEWPWLAAIFVKKTSSLNYICGGTCISKRHIITAAHCVHDPRYRNLLSASNFVVKMGQYNIHDWTNENTKIFNVRNIRIHPSFNNQSFAYDMAILVLSQPVVFSDFISPVCLWEGNTDLALVIYQKGTVVGWGRDENGIQTTSEPRRADLTLVSTDMCRASRPEYHSITNNKTLCAGNLDGSGPCNGDSGNGLYMYRDGRWLLRGVVSMSLSHRDNPYLCSTEDYYVFSDAAQFLPWIRRMLGIRNIQQHTTHDRLDPMLWRIGSG